jgi:hypothetical protein
MPVLAPPRRRLQRPSADDNENYVADAQANSGMDADHAVCSRCKCDKHCIRCNAKHEQCCSTSASLNVEHYESQNREVTVGKWEMRASVLLPRFSFDLQRNSIFAAYDLLIEYGMSNDFSHHGLKTRTEYCQCMNDDRLENRCSSRVNTFTMTVFKLIESKITLRFGLIDGEVIS